MEDKKIRKLHIVHNCGECIFHEKIELSKTHLGAYYLTPEKKTATSIGRR